VFQALPHTLGMPAPTVRLLTTCHSRRNRVEYEGLLDISEQLLSELLAEATRPRGQLIGASFTTRRAIRRLKPPLGAFGDVP
jgi:hypothetical protein